LEFSLGESEEKDGKKNEKSGEKKEGKCGVKKKKYTLVSLISHSGNEHYGHYYTFRRMDKSQQNWFFISDTASRECNEQLVKCSMPYMLFYELA
jgi:ubiquitin C-terminal hydrolase